LPNAHEPELIATIAIGLALAFVAGLAAKRLGMSPIVGYLIAGVAVGPFTPGFVADIAVATELAEIGVILLMFGVGLHFSLRDLAAVRSIAIPGALGHIVVASILGTAVGIMLGWDLGEAIVLGLAISVASTVVLTRALTERGELLSTQGRIAVGWLIVEDVCTVVVLVLLPSLAAVIGGSTLADPTSVAGDVAFAIARAAIFALLILVVGIRLVPWLLDLVAGLRDRELFTLAAVAIALGIAYVSNSLFGVSLALGAFLAGAVVSESDTSHQVAADAQPLREVFSVLFFVSVGMLFDPTFLVANLPAVVAVVLVVLVATPVAAFAITAMLGQQPRVGLTVAAGVAQIGEFSFILATSGFVLGIFPADGIQLVVSAAIVSITVNPFLFAAIDPLSRRIANRPRLKALAGARAGELSSLPETEVAPHSHAVVIGSGRVGRLVIGALDRRGFPFVVVSSERHDVQRLRDQGYRALFGDASNIEVLKHAHLETARVLVVAIPDEHASGLVIHHARDLNPSIALVVRTHSASQMATLGTLEGSVQPIQGELELGVQMARYALRRFGVSMIEAEAIAEGLRSRRGRPWPLESA
jgi:CPA2 family monovalent cation:H+ antiporter-2